jgi:DNA ligase 1
VKFYDVARAFDAIEAESSRLVMTKQLADLFTKADVDEAPTIAYLAMGKLRPSYKGTQFNIARKNMLGIVARATENDQDTAKASYKELGDLGRVYQELCLQGDLPTDMTVMQVNQKLCELEEISGIGSQEYKAQALINFLGQLDCISAKYVVRIVLGTLRLGFSDMTILDALSWMLVGDKSMRLLCENAYNVCADLGRVAHSAKVGGAPALEEMTIIVGIPIRPAAAERTSSPQALFDKLGPCIVQEKLDGFRVQIHIQRTVGLDSSSKPTINFYSRNLQNMTEMFPDLREAFERFDVDTLICEGEAIVIDEQTGSFLPFQETVKRKRKHGVEGAARDMPLTFFMFDILYLNGQSMLGLAHAQRRQELERVVGLYGGDTVRAIDEGKVETVGDIERYFARTVEHGLEGLVAKKPDAIYRPGKRNFNWIKFKRHETGQLDDTIDCVILGYYSGRGKRASFGIGAILVGLYNTEQDRFETVAKIGTGLSDEQWQELKAKCDALAVPDKPKNVVCNKQLVPDVWVNPEIVCLVRADEITKSPVHAAGAQGDELGYALRFPRFMGYRSDKSAELATDLHELRRLFSLQFN